ncbi:MAG: DUF370 domain-containing protein [Oscillospiraceae bacterium]|jgi:hypothetical protein|nr:DUF370 domain-containing protein [Oscillospiraceae bacterium]
MYLHLGSNVVVPHAAVIGVFDLELTSQSRLTKQFLTRAEREGRIETASDDLPASFVLCQRDGGARVYLSQISAATLAKRFEKMSGFSRQGKTG